MAVLEGKFLVGDAIVVRPDGKGALEFSSEPAATQARPAAAAASTNSRALTSSAPKWGLTL
jgi:hypothetical protein